MSDEKIVWLNGAEFAETLKGDREIILIKSINRDYNGFLSKTLKTSLHLCDC